jgi:hypothetical protein
MLGVHDVQLDPEPTGYSLRGTYLLDLVVVVVNRQQDKPEFVHKAPPSATFFMEPLPGAASKAGLQQIRMTSANPHVYLVLLPIAFANKTLSTRW